MILSVSSRVSGRRVNEMRMEVSMRSSIRKRMLYQCSRLTAMSASVMLSKMIELPVQLQ